MSTNQPPAIYDYQYNSSNANSISDKELEKDSNDNLSEVPQAYTPRRSTDLEANIHELHRLESLHRNNASDPEFPTLDEQNVIARIISGGRDNDSFIFKTLGGGRPIPHNVGDATNFQVDFEGPTDPAHPLNWSTREKLLISVPLALFALVSAWGSSIFSVAVDFIAPKFHVAPVVINLGVSLYVSGYAFGPIVWSPLSEVYGRKITIMLSVFLFVCFTFAAATAQDIQTLMIARFFSGASGSSPFTVGAAIFADMYGPKVRGKAVELFCLVLFCGPLLAPVVGGFIVESYLGWRWLLYITGIMSGAVFILLCFFLKETFAPLILVDKAEQLRQQTGNWAIHAAHENVKIDFGQIVTKTIIRPWKMLATEPILLLISIYNGFCYCILYLLLSSYPYVFVKQYHWTLSHAMIPYIGVLVGMIIGVMSMVLGYEQRYVKRMETGAKIPPEARIEPMKPAGISFAVGLFLFFWSSNYPQHVHWAVPTISGVFTGYGILGILVPSVIYIIECYLVFAASALAGLTFLRSAMGASSPLFADFMFNGLGLNWTGLLLGLIAVGLAFVPFMFSIYGAKLRRMSKFAFDL